MRRTLRPSAAFLRAFRRWVKQHPEDEPTIQATLESLAEDASQPSLKTHKLKGRMASYWACSAGYDLRIVFSFLQEDGGEAIVLHTVGTHDDVY